MDAVRIEGGFAEVGAGTWLMGRGQPAAFLGSAVRRRRKGFFLRDRASLDLFETSDMAKCADASRPFLTHIPCVDRVFAVSGKVLVASAAARLGAETVKLIPMSARGALGVTAFGLGGAQKGAAIPPSDAREGHFVVMATASRTARIQVADGATLSARPESVVAWTGNRPTGFCPKLGVLDMILPRGPKDLLLHFHGPCIVWIEGSMPRLSPFQLSNSNSARRRFYGA